MVTAQGTEEIVRKKDYGIRVLGIVVRNQSGNTLYLRQSQATEILDRFPDGRFNNQDYNVRFGPYESTVVGEDDNLTVESVIYGNLGFDSDLYREQFDFGEYVELGRQEFVRVDLTKKMTGV